MVNGRNDIGNVSYCSNVLNNKLYIRIPITKRLPNYVSFEVGDDNIYLDIDGEEIEFSIIDVGMWDDFKLQITCISENSFDNIELISENIIGSLAYRKSYIGEPTIGKEVRRYLWRRL